MAYLTIKVGPGLFRKLIIDEAHVVSAWDLREIGEETIARDFVFGMNHGTYVGAGWTKGISVDLPEGAICRRFAGSEYVLVPHDGDGFTREGDATERTLSLRNGGFNIPILFRTSQSDATLRCLAQKQETNSTGNGWHVAIQSGAIEGYLKVGGVVVFNFQRGSGLADGEWHLVDLVYQPSTGTGEVRIFIDGVQAGATVTGVTTEPATNTGNMRIGMFNDGSGGFIGDISYVMVGRNANASLPAALQATRTWIDISDDVLGEPVEIQDGIPGLTLADIHAGIGTASWVMDNERIKGRYTIGHANQLAGFEKGHPILITIEPGEGGSTDTPLVLFHGRMKTADPEPGYDGGQRVFCQAEDWYAACVAEVKNLPILTNVRSDHAWAALVNRAAYPPMGVAMTAGSETFPYVFDRAVGALLTEMVAVCRSEGGYGYIREGIPTFEPRSVRQIDTVVDAVLDETDIQGMRVEDAKIINTYRLTITPRREDPSDTVVLYELEDPQFIAAGEERVFEPSYQDPGQSRSQIGGTDFQEPLTPNTDYTFTSLSGGGIDLIASVTVDAELGGSGARLVVKATAAGWFSFQIRGRPLRTDQPLPETVEDGDSIREHGIQVFETQFHYLNSLDTARSIAQLGVNLFKTQTRFPTELTRTPAPGSDAEEITYRLGPGSLVSTSEYMSAISSNSRFWVQNRRLIFTPPFLMQAVFGLFPSYAMGDLPIWVWDVTNWDEHAWGV